MINVLVSRISSYAVACNSCLKTRLISRCTRITLAQHYISRKLKYEHYIIQNRAEICTPLNSRTSNWVRTSFATPLALHSLPFLNGKESKALPTSFMSDIPEFRNNSISIPSCCSSKRFKEPSSHPVESLGDRVRRLLIAYSSLSKIRLGSLVVLTTMVGYIMSPNAFVLSTFLWTTLGTSLATASANAFNQLMEVHQDSRMKRTFQRALPSGGISQKHALLFALVTGLSGPLLLLQQVNFVSAGLASWNIILYAGVYTPMKLRHPLNTWIGSVVGAIPPMIGWAASTGGLENGAWALAAILYVWQIPHFLSLSWSLRKDYAGAGYKMLSNVQPSKVPAATLRWSLYTLPLGAFCSFVGITTWTFAFDSLLIDGYLIWKAIEFYKDNQNSKSRKVFFATLIHLPLFLGLMIIHKIPSIWGFFGM